MTKVPLAQGARIALALLIPLTLFGCGTKSTGSGQSEAASGGNDAQQSGITVQGSEPGASPFIASVELGGTNTSELASITFSIAPKPNTVSQAVNVSWSITALNNRGYVAPTTVYLPIFGLYANYANSVTLNLSFQDGSTQQLQTDITTDAYTDPNGVYTSPTINVARSSSSTLGFNYFYMKSGVGSPVIVDTDGEERWVAPGPKDSQSSYFADGKFLIGNPFTPATSVLGLDGIYWPTTNQLPQPLLSNFTHNIDPGASGVLGEFYGTDSLGDSVGDIVVEFPPFSGGAPIQTFDLATILASYMNAAGDDASAFVRPGADWFHVNSSAYDPSDDSIIVSSRENFLIKLDYTTHDIIWIFGDPTKYWYTFPSLKAKAITLAAGGLYPIGQHAISITSDGYLMVMNDGLGSQNQPAGEPAGLTRSYSEVSTYAVDTATMTAQQMWGFDYGQSIYSDYCGSSYEASGNTYLVDYATTSPAGNARLVGLDSNHNVVFDFQYSSPLTCSSSWNAVPISLENLVISD